MIERLASVCMYDYIPLFLLRFIVVGRGRTNLQLKIPVELERSRVLSHVEALRGGTMPSVSSYQSFIYRQLVNFV
jgi:hypothetical protein